MEEEDVAWPLHDGLRGLYGLSFFDSACVITCPVLACTEVEQQNRKYSAAAQCIFSWSNLHDQKRCVLGTPSSDVPGCFERSADGSA